MNRDLACVSVALTTAAMAVGCTLVIPGLDFKSQGPSPAPTPPTASSESDGSTQPTARPSQAATPALEQTPQPSPSAQPTGQAGPQTVKDTGNLIAFRLPAGWRVAENCTGASCKAIVVAQKGVGEDFVEIEVRIEDGRTVPRPGTPEWDKYISLVHESSISGGFGNKLLVSSAIQFGDQIGHKLVYVSQPYSSKHLEAVTATKGALYTLELYVSPIEAFEAHVQDAMYALSTFQFIGTPTYSATPTPAPTPTPSPTPTPVVFEDSVHKYAIGYPAKWHVNKACAGCNYSYASRTLLNLDGSTTFVSIWVWVGSSNADLSDDIQFANYARKEADLATQLKGAAGLATASVTLGGQRALEMQYWKASLLGWEQTRQVSTVRTGKEYRVEFAVTPRERFGEFGGLATGTFATFRFLP